MYKSSWYRLGSLALLAATVAPGMAVAASDVSDSGGAPHVVPARVTSSMAAKMTADLISNVAGGGFVPSSGTGGGFAPSSGSGGGFTPSSSGGDLGKQSGLAPSFSTRGLSAGGASAKFGLWGQGTYSHVNSSETNMGLSGRIGNYIIGGDRRFSPSVLAGVALSLENSNLDTSYNQGTFKSRGVSIIPYLGITLDPTWTVDVALGYGWITYDANRASPGGTINSSYDAVRRFFSTNLVGNYAVDNWRIQPKVGMLYINEIATGYTDSSGLTYDSESNKFGRLTAGSKIGYSLGDSVPYIKVMGEWDAITPNSVLKSNGEFSSVSRGGGVLGVGYEINRGGLIGSLEVNNNALFRSNLELWSVALRARFDF